MYIYIAVVLAVSRITLKQLFLHMNQEHCDRKKDKENWGEKGRVILINFCTGKFVEVNMPFNAQQYPHIQ